MFVCYVCVMFVCHARVSCSCHVRVLCSCHVRVLYSCVMFACYVRVLYSCVTFVCYVRVMFVSCSCCLRVMFVCHASVLCSCVMCVCSVLVLYWCYTRTCVMFVCYSRAPCSCVHPFADGLFSVSECVKPSFPQDIVTFLAQEFPDPDGIRRLVENVKGLTLSVTPQEINKLSADIQQALSVLTGIDEILESTAQNLTEAMDLRERAEQARYPNMFCPLNMLVKLNHLGT